jgi:hypothetical protein
VSRAVRLAFTADMGTVAPYGFAVAAALAREHLEDERFDAVLLDGDLSYSTTDPHSCSPTNPGCDSHERVWDAFGRQIAPYASTAMLLTSVGNHEHVPGNITLPGGSTRLADFAAYSARYAPLGGAMPFWYSVDLGPVHLVAASSEHAVAKGSEQWAWLDADLAAVDRRVTPWVIVALHRPVLSAAVLEWEDHRPGGKLSAALEPLFRTHAVDLCVAGHIHSMDRTHAVFNGTVTDRPAAGDATSTYVNPRAPMYVTQGTSGALPENVFYDPPPVWSAARDLVGFGYGRLQVSATSLRWEYVSVGGKTIDSWGINKTRSAAPPTAAESLGRPQVESLGRQQADSPGRS